MDVLETSALTTASPFRAAEDMERLVVEDVTSKSQEDRHE